MNNPKKMTTFVGVLLLLIATIAYYFYPQVYSSDIDVNPFDARMQAYDHFFMQRAYPETAIDLKSYFKTLRNLDNTVEQRTPPNGFSADWQLEGPGNTGARVNTIAVHPFDEKIIYAGFSTGGLFKTTDGGQSWVPIFDDQAYLSIGHITIDPIFPDVIYVGTGDPNISAYPFIGNGLYRSPDGGATWEHLGLNQQRIISKVVVDPSNFNNLFVATMGLPFARDNNRGIYKSTDAGETWQQTLLISDSTGVIDLVINPNNPNVLYASSWDRIRNNAESIAYGYGAGIYKSSDGGDNWTELTSGLPTGKFSRVNLSMSGINPNIIFAVYVDTTYQLHSIYKTSDAGANWNLITQGGAGSQLAFALGGQGWYNSKIRVSPFNDNELYLLGVNLWKTTSGGAVWTRVVSPPGTLQPHVDNHDLVFTSAGDIIIGTDGGIYKQLAGQSTWVKIDKIATTQFYRVGYNPNKPNLYYGGAQDNGISVGNAGGRDSWNILFPGDGFRTLFHPSNNNKQYVQLQLGKLYSTDNGGVDYQLATFGIPSSESRNWDAPVIMSAHDPNRLYTGTDRVYTASEPSSLSQWAPTSPVLTGNSNLPSRFKTISALAESPVEDSLLYAGTSDGELWRSEDAGTSWTSIKNGLPNRYISSVVASPDLEDFVYVTFSGYRDNDNTPLVYRSWDRGDTWFSVAGDLPDLAVNDLLVAPNNLDVVLFAATDGGVYASLNEGGSWDRLGGNMPTVPVFDLELNVAQKRLIAGTFGRSIMSFSLDTIGVSIDSLALVSYSGSVKTLSGQGIKGVTIAYNGAGSSQSIPADDEGDFNISNVPLTQTCNIRPIKNDNPRNGLTTFDIVLIQKHILDIAPFVSPISIIAADANSSRSVTTFDAVILRKLILQIDTAFAQNTSWRFIKSDYLFNNPTDPFGENFPEVYECMGSSSGDSDILFTGFKVGDVNGSANPMMFNSTEDRQLKDSLIFHVKDQDLLAGEEYRIDFHSNNFKDILGYQFTLEFDNERIEMLAEVDGQLPALDKANFGWNHCSKGQLTSSWSYGKAASVEDNAAVFSLYIKALVDSRLSEVLEMSSLLATAEAYDEFEDILGLALRFDPIATMPIASMSDFQLLSNQPNPFHTHTTVRFMIPEAGQVELELLDWKGQLLKASRQFFVAGVNEFHLQAADFPSEGLYHYRVKAMGKIRTAKLVIIR